MNKRTFSNLLSKEKAKYEAEVAKFRKLNESCVSESDGILSTSGAAVSDEIHCDAKDVKLRDEEEIRQTERMATQPAVNSNETTDTAMVLQQILETLGRLESRQKEILNRVSAVESALAEKMPERAEVQAQGQILRECKVLSTKTHRSISRITGDVGSEDQILLQSLLPISSEETLKKMEEHLTHKAHADAMAHIIFNLKSTNNSIEKVLQSLFSDELVWLYNCDGKAGKKALIKLKIVDLTLAAFPSMHIDKISAIKHYVRLSHNRYKQIRRSIKKSF
ncbi:uncharacterized protein LOC105211834 [Zeugodacus cucurbitae]|uniref:uncharacterized protein LOC105211834 n=1 Tax=Zeugodacus cucurbitae TaxID=28588 RepID=UPI0023D930D4|nr:uncharacterized protein LOC105211834 [Zeugodacus cucurbitae]XP_054086507.1 uncharacterized protein LOC105211834 [Zeugodacus cucurbitae]XP_054086508.1 uncharacterized protein LOC105211834 [Zeugodacus cucurbitae]XP_054086509.1 uncharacterized protein LOC105211834 [Zeugodacus cucurbitae]XP_054086510.1 uncharacterized protein LOC105211834 [Zeugodacus cucurbitae]XP_054086511.1 uncharacterized protein LOC105211834 [Zeugodacus cucurbitae]XP_054086512.1 uncharacterized protein LOC105211834 [Zeugod